MKAKNIQPTKTILTIVIGFIVVHIASHQNWALWLSLIIGLLGLSSAIIGRNIHWLWMKLTYVLSLVIPNLLLSVVFYFVLLPMALLSRVFGKSDPMMLKNNFRSTFMVVDRTFSKRSFEKPW